MRRLKIHFDKTDNRFVMQEQEDISKHSEIEFEKPLKVSFSSGYAYVELAI